MELTDATGMFAAISLSSFLLIIAALTMTVMTEIQRRAQQRAFDAAYEKLDAALDEEGADEDALLAEYEKTRAPISFPVKIMIAVVLLSFPASFLVSHFGLQYIELDGTRVDYIGTEHDLMQDILAQSDSQYLVDYDEDTVTILDALNSFDPITYTYDECRVDTASRDGDQRTVTVGCFGADPLMMKTLDGDVIHVAYHQNPKH